MENNKLGQEPAFPFFKENEVGYGDTIVVTDQFGVKGFYPFEKGVSKRIFIATQITAGMMANNKQTKHTSSIFTRILQLFFPWVNLSHSTADAEQTIRIAYKYTDELLKQENEN